MRLDPCHLEGNDSIQLVPYFMWCCCNAGPLAERHSTALRMGGCSAVLLAAVLKFSEWLLDGEGHRGGWFGRWSRGHHCRVELDRRPVKGCKRDKACEVTARRARFGVGISRHEIVNMEVHPAARGLSGSVTAECQSLSTRPVQKVCGLSVLLVLTSRRTQNPGKRLWQKPEEAQKLRRTADTRSCTSCTGLAGG